MYTAVVTPCVLLMLACESHPQNLLLATSAGVKTLSVGNSSINTLHHLPATSIDFRYAKGDIYYISGNTIMYSYYSHIKEEYADPMPSVRADLPLTDVAVDWRAFRTYSTSQASGIIYEAKLLGSSPRPILTGLTGLGDLAIDPYERLLFVIKEGSLVFYELGKYQEHQFNLSSQVGGEVTRVAVDCHERMVYTLSVDGEEGVLVATEYDSPKSRTVGRSVKLRGATGLSVAGGLAVWAVDSSLYLCRLTPECRPETIFLFWTTNETIHDVKLNSPISQSPSVRFLCQHLNCSHSCEQDSRSWSSAICTCPEGMEVSPQGNICTNKTMLTIWKEYFISLLREACRKWLEPLREQVVYLLYVCCVLMLALGLSGLCLILVTKSTEHSQRRDCYRLTEATPSRKLSSSLTQL